MANEQNLIKNEDLTPTQRRENASRAGKASVKAKKRKKQLKECLEILLETSITDKNGQKMTGAEAMAAKVFQQALKGNLKAFEIVRDTAGQKPIERVMHAEVDPEVIAEIERMVDDDSDESD